jgi:hypothetical protein
MNTWMKVLTKLCLLTTLLTTFSVSAENYRAKICSDCNEVEAKRIALKFKTEITCHKDDNIGLDLPKCYYQPNQILVANPSTGQVWGFELFRDNKGGGEDDGKLNVQRFSVSGQAEMLMTDILTIYSKLDVVRDTVNQHLENTPSLFDSKANTSGTKPFSNCDDSSNIAKAVRATFDAGTQSNIQQYLQIEYKGKHSKPESKFAYSYFAADTFSVGAGGVGIEGTRDFRSIGKLLEVNFSSDDSSPARNKIMYNVEMKNHVIALRVNEHGSRLDGLAISALRNGGTINVSACLLEQLNKYLEASVQTNPAGGSFGDSSPEDYGRGREFIPHSSGSDGGIETCTWRFYDSQGEQIFSMQGPCP